MKKIFKHNEHKDVHWDIPQYRNHWLIVYVLILFIYIIIRTGENARFGSFGEMVPGAH